MYSFLKAFLVLMKFLEHFNISFTKSVLNGEYSWRMHRKGGFQT